MIFSFTTQKIFIITHMMLINVIRILKNSADINHTKTEKHKQVLLVLKWLAWLI